MWANNYWSNNYWGVRFWSSGGAPLVVTSTVCFDGIIVDLNFNGEQVNIYFNGTIKTKC